MTANKNVTGLRVAPPLVAFAHLSGEEGHGRAVDPGVVSRRRHPLQVVLSFLRRDASARQLAVVHRDLISLHRLLHGDQRVCQQHSGRSSSQSQTPLDKTMLILHFTF